MQGDHETVGLRSGLPCFESAQSGSDCVKPVSQGVDFDLSGGVRS